MLIERNQVVIGVVVSLLLAVGTVFAIALSGGLFKPGMQIEAEFADAAGLRSGSFVFVAGVRVGEVLEVEIVEDRVVTRFTLQSDGVPTDSSADIIIQNTLGKRAISLEPGGSTDYLEAGDRIPLARTGTPIDLPELGDRSANLLGNVDTDALQGLMTAVSDITEGKREDLASLLDGLQRVTDIVVERRAELEQVLQRAEQFVDAAAEKDQEIVEIVDNISVTLDTLVRRRADVTRLLEETARTSTLTADLVEERRAQIDRVLNELHADLEILDAHQVDLAHFLAYVGVGVEGFASIGYSGGDEVRADNPSWGNVFTTGLGQIGIDALFGCGGTFDELFTELIGPDPRCEEGGGAQSEEAEETDQTDDGAQPAAATRADGLAGFFQPRAGPRSAPTLEQLVAAAGGEVRR